MLSRKRVRRVFNEQREIECVKYTKRVSFFLLIRRHALTARARRLSLLSRLCAISKGQKRSRRFFNYFFFLFFERKEPPKAAREAKEAQNVDER